MSPIAILIKLFFYALYKIHGVAEWHTRRVNPSYQGVQQRITKGELKIRQMYVQTYFIRRKNINALGWPRPGSDRLLWCHAAHCGSVPLRER